MLKQFFFGSTDSPLFMFHHALGAVLIIIFTCLLIAAISSWFSSRKKKKPAIHEQIITAEKKSEEIVSATPKVLIREKEKPIEVDAPVKKVEVIIPNQEPASKIIEQPKTVTEETEVFNESICNTAEQLLHFTEIMLNKKLTEQDWDKRLPENILLDHRSYHQLIFQLIYLNADTTQTTSRFKLVLETATEVAINHQIYFRNWMMPQELTAAFKSESTVTPDEKRIRTAVKIAEKKNWKLQSSTSEQGTMINLLMKCAIPK